MKEVCVLKNKSINKLVFIIAVTNEIAVSKFRASSILVSRWILFFWLADMYYEGIFPMFHPFDSYTWMQDTNLKH